MKIENAIVISSDSENQVSDHESMVSWAGIISDNNQDNVEDDEMTSSAKSEPPTEYLMSGALEPDDDLLKLQRPSGKSLPEGRQILERCFDSLSKRLNLPQSLGTFPMGAAEEISMEDL